jgi:hypothetical protein
MCDPPCGFTAQNPDQVTKHACKNLPPEPPSDLRTSKRHRDGPGEDPPSPKRAKGNSDDHPGSKKKGKARRPIILSSPPPDERGQASATSSWSGIHVNDPDPYDASSLATSPALRMYSLYVEKRFGVVICLDCSEAVHLHFVRKHAVEHGFAHVPNQETLSNALEELGALKVSAIQFPLEPVPAIPGLSVTLGYQCQEPDCAHISTSERCKNEHLQQFHPRAQNRQVARVHVQILYKFKGSRVVMKVIPPDKPRLPSNRYYDAFMEEFNSRKASKTIYRLAPDPKMQSHYIYSSGWGKVLEGQDVAALRDLVAAPEDGDRYKPLVKACREHYTHVADRLDNVSELFRRWINSTKSYVSSLFHRLALTTDTETLKTIPFGVPRPPTISPSAAIFKPAFSPSQCASWATAPGVVFRLPKNSSRLPRLSKRPWTLPRYSSQDSSTTFHSR